MKIVVNRCFGGFSVSDAVVARLGLEPEEEEEEPGWSRKDWRRLDNGLLGLPETEENREAYRADPRLVEAVEALGNTAASGKYADLEVVEIPDGVAWVIEEYDGWEHVAEVHRTW